MNDIERDVLSLPARFGGLGISKPNVICMNQYENSAKLSLPLARLIRRQERELDPEEVLQEVRHIRKSIDEDSEQMHKLKLEHLLTQSSPALKFALKVTTEKGASSWVTAHPLLEHGTVLHKGDFVDAIYMRYGWVLPGLPTSCACGHAFNVQHALDCKLGGFRRTNTMKCAICLEQ